MILYVFWPYFDFSDNTPSEKNCQFLLIYLQLFYDKFKFANGVELRIWRKHFRSCTYILYDWFHERIDLYSENLPIEVQNKKTSFSALKHLVYLY